MNCRSEGIDADTRPRPQVSGALVERDGPIIHIIQARQPIPCELWTSGMRRSLDLDKHEQH